MKIINLGTLKIRFLLFGYFALLAGTAEAQHPFKYDSLYKTMYANEFCRFIQDNPDVVLIDVRSAGEFCDTSHMASLNKGHLKGAINISVDSIKSNIHVLDSYKDKPIVFYCSHSQRSRRVSKLLSENGFANYYNLNGGMTSLNELHHTDFPCKEELIISGLAFSNRSCDDLARLIRTEKNLVIIDVRPSIQFNAKDTIADNNIGRIKGAINIPYDEFQNRQSELDPYRSQSILVYSASGDGDGSRTAAALANNGFNKVNLLLTGLNDFIASQDVSLFVENGTPFTIVNPLRALKLLKDHKDLIVYDTRVSEEYNNARTGTISYKNLGHIRNAIHTEKQHFSSVPLSKNKGTPILIYGNEEAAEFASYLATKGYKKVFLLTGLYDFVWSAFNVESCKDAIQFLTDHVGIY